VADYVIPAVQPVVVPVQGGGFFPVRRVYCVGRNYAEHVKEMGNDLRDPPFFFEKPADAIVIDNAPIAYPPQTHDFHHEIELVVAIGKDGIDLSPESALEHVFGYSIGLDMTRRDLQAEAKKQGRPWTMAKGFDQSAPIGQIVPASAIGHPKSGAITLTVNGTLRQSGDLAEQIWSVPETIAFLSRFVALKAGDLVMTGTPAGVSAVVRGDVLEGSIDGIGTIKAEII
jgi:fumarylpyruvate hydrolase